MRVIHLSHDEDLALDIVQGHGRPGLLHCLHDCVVTRGLALHQVGLAEGPCSELLDARVGGPDISTVLRDEELSPNHTRAVEGAAPKCGLEQLEELLKGEGVVVVCVELLEQLLGLLEVGIGQVQLGMQRLQAAHEAIEIQHTLLVGALLLEDLLRKLPHLWVCQQLQSAPPRLTIDRRRQCVLGPPPRLSPLLPGRRLRRCLAHRALPRVPHG
mmetsp:Transcript_1701/g.5465  ORF Transcript_1701/g.5465 Transcript_1701/m.5465 type:complete len:214 (+) Transcript_1701:1332-1973(+)